MSVVKPFPAEPVLVPNDTSSEVPVGMAMLMGTSYCGEASVFYAVHAAVVSSATIAIVAAVFVVLAV